MPGGYNRFDQLFRSILAENKQEMISFLLNWIQKSWSLDFTVEKWHNRFYHR